MLHKRWTFIQPDVRNCGKGILKMKKILSFVLMMCVLMTIPMFAFAAVSGDEPLTIGTPFMITNAGQGPGGKMGRLLVSRAGTLTEDEDFYYVDVPYAADVDARDYSAIVIVIGSTDKGLGATGCVSWKFEHKGVIVIDNSKGLDEDELMMLALDAGADDVEIGEGVATVYTDPSSFSEVRENLEKAGCTFLEAERRMVPTTTTAVTDPETVEKVQRLLDELDDYDDTQNVYHDAELPEDEEEDD